MKFRKFESSSGDGGKNFFKLKDGESAKGVFRGEIHEFRIKWEGGRSVVIENADPSKNNRFKLNFVVYEEGRFVPKIWEFSLMVYGLLSAIAAEYPLEKTKVKITRQGTGMDTTYHVLPLLNEPLSPAILKQIEALDLNVLDASPKPAATKDEHGFPPDFGDPPPDMDNEQDLPF